MFKGLSLAHRFQKEEQTALDLDTKNLDAREDLVDFYLEAPGIAGGDKNKAHTLADEIVKIDPARGYIVQAQVAQKEKDLTRQEAALLQAVKAGPKNYDAQEALASFYCFRPDEKI